MRRLLLAAAAVFLLAPAAYAAPNATNPATVRGVVVAKDKAHRAIVVAARRDGAVRAIVAPRAFRTLDVGQRVAVRYRLVPGKLATAVSVAAEGRSRTALVRGTVIRVANRRAILSAGGSALSVTLVTPKRQRQLSATGSDVKAGDHVQAQVEIHENGSLDAGQVVITAGAAPVAGGVSEGELEVRGTVTGLSPFAVKTGTGVAVSCIVPAGTAVTGMAVGDLVEVECDLIGGQWTLRSAHKEGAAGAEHATAPEHANGSDDDTAEHGDHGGDTSGKVEVKGMLTSLDPLTVTPATGAAVTCRVPTGVSLAGFATGQPVEITCRTVDGTLTLVELHADNADTTPSPDSGESHD